MVGTGGGPSQGAKDGPVPARFLALLIHSYLKENTDKLAGGQPLSPGQTLFSEIETVKR